MLLQSWVEANVGGANSWRLSHNREGLHPRTPFGPEVLFHINVGLHTKTNGSILDLKMGGRCLAPS